MPRRYSEDEVAIALILSEVIRIPIQVRALREIGERLREIVHFGPKNGVIDAIWFATTEEAEQMKAEMFEQFLALRDAGKSAEGDEICDKLEDLERWALFELARSGVRRLTDEGYGPREVSDTILELSVDDADRWTLEVVSASTIQDGFIAGQSVFAKDDTAPERVWSLHLLINLSRIFTRLPVGQRKMAVEMGTA